jgi:hypothetical protein
MPARAAAAKGGIPTSRTISLSGKFPQGKISRVSFIVTVSFGRFHTRDALELAIVRVGADFKVHAVTSFISNIFSMGEGATPLEVARLLGLTSEQVLDQLFELITQGPLSSIPSFFESQEEKAIDFLALNRDFLEYLRLKIRNPRQNPPRDAEIL